MNHRQLFSSIDVPSCFVNESNVKQWNKGVVKGSIRLSQDSLLLYGSSGIWISDSTLTSIKSMNKGINNGSENRKIVSVAQMHDGTLWCASTYKLYKYNKAKWHKIDFEGGSEKIQKITTVNDSIIVLTRSHVYLATAPKYQFKQITLTSTKEEKKRDTLFRIFTKLHSGALFGLPGRVFVDIIALSIILLSITSYFYFFSPRLIKQRKAKNKSITHLQQIFKWSVKWHNKVGSITIIFTCIIALTGLSYRAPLKNWLLSCRTNILSVSQNTWEEKLFGIQKDTVGNRWIISTYEGMYETPQLDKPLKEIKVAPPISRMGITVMEKTDTNSNEWIIGSFSGIYNWNITTGSYYPLIKEKNKTAGYIPNFKGGSIIFDNSKGAILLNQDGKMPNMPKEMEKNNISFYTFCKMIHNGLFFQFLGNVVVEYYVSFNGWALLIVLLSGYIIIKITRFRNKKN